MPIKQLTPAQEAKYDKATKQELLKLVEQVPAHSYFHVASMMRAACKWAGDQHPDEILLLDLALAYGLDVLNPESAQHEVNEYIERFNDVAGFSNDFRERHPEMLTTKGEQQ